MVSEVIKGCGAVTLTDNTGTALTASTSMTSWYKLVFTEADTKYAYFNLALNGSSQIIPAGISLSQGNIRVVSTNSTTLTFAFQMNVKNAASDSDNWQPLPAYDASFAGANAQKVNTIYQQLENIYDTPCRIAITVTDATTVWLQVTTVN